MHHCITAWEYQSSSILLSLPYLELQDGQLMLLKKNLLKLLPDLHYTDRKLCMLVNIVDPWAVNTYQSIIEQIKTKVY